MTSSILDKIQDLLFFLRCCRDTWASTTSVNMGRVFLCWTTNKYPLMSGLQGRLLAVLLGSPDLFFWSWPAIHQSRSQSQPVTTSAAHDIFSEVLELGASSTWVGVECKQIEYGQILLILYLFLYFYSNAESDTDSVTFLLNNIIMDINIIKM